MTLRDGYGVVVEPALQITLEVSEVQNV